MYVLGKSYDEMSDQETLIKVTVVLEQLVAKVKDLSDKVDNIKDEHVKETASTLATHREKIARMESIIYWTMSVVFVETIAIVGAVIVGLK